MDSRGVKTFFLNLWFFSAFAVYGLFNMPIFFGVTFADRLMLPRTTAMRRLRLRIQRFGRHVIWLLRPIAPVIREGPGWEKAQPERCVYVSNHRSFSDPWLISQLPDGSIVQIVNRWPFKIPVLGLVARLAGYMDVKRMTLEHFLETGSRLLLEENIMLVSFPEGTRSASRKLGAFHGELFRLVKQTGVPLFPLVITGNERTPRKGSPILHPSTIRMRLLEPLTEADYRDWSAFKLKETVRDRIRHAAHNMEGAVHA
jgi:1-acyl-sn-glycerol-3-phosphate acyltransferase